MSFFGQNIFVKFPRNVVSMYEDDPTTPVQSLQVSTAFLKA